MKFLFKIFLVLLIFNISIAKLKKQEKTYNFIHDSVRFSDSYLKVEENSDKSYKMNYLEIKLNKLSKGIDFSIKFDSTPLELLYVFNHDETLDGLYHTGLFKFDIPIQHVFISHKFYEDSLPNNAELIFSFRKYRDMKDVNKFFDIIITSKFIFNDYNETIFEYIKNLSEERRQYIKVISNELREFLKYDNVEEKLLGNNAVYYATTKDQIRLITQFSNSSKIHLRYLLKLRQRAIFDDKFNGIENSISKTIQYYKKQLNDSLSKQIDFINKKKTYLNQNSQKIYDKKIDFIRSDIRELNTTLNLNQLNEKINRLFTIRENTKYELITTLNQPEV